jgi:acyl carrier protein
MDESQIYARLGEVFHDVFDDDSIKIGPELSAKDVDGWDSLTHIRLILTIEKSFGIRFRVGEVEATKNLGGLADLIAKRLSQG